MKRIHLIISILVTATRKNDYSFINNNPRPLALNPLRFYEGFIFILFMIVHNIYSNNGYALYTT